MRVKPFSFSRRLHRKKSSRVYLAITLFLPISRLISYLDVTRSRSSERSSLRSTDLIPRARKENGTESGRSRIYILDIVRNRKLLSKGLPNGSDSNALDVLTIESLLRTFQTENSNVPLLNVTLARGLTLSSAQLSRRHVLFPRPLPSPSLLSLSFPLSPHGPSGLKARLPPVGLEGEILPPSSSTTRGGGEEAGEKGENVLVAGLLLSPFYAI